jgi:bacillolysin
LRPTRLLSAALAGALLTGVLTALTAPAQAAAQPDPSAAAERELKQQSSGKVTVRRDARGVVHFVGAEPGKPVRKPVGVSATASAARQAAGYLQRYEALWALDNPGAGVRVARTHEGGKGSVVRFQQTVDGMPVVGGELAVALDADGDLQSVSGETTPLQLPDAAHTVTSAKAQQAAVALAARVHGLRASQLQAGPAEAYAYDPALLGPAGKPGLVPVWRVEVTGPAHVRHLVLVDRTRGGVVLQYNQVHNASRLVCNYSNSRSYDLPCRATSSVKARAEGDPATGIAEVDRAYDNVGHTSDFYATELGVDLTELIASAEDDGNQLRASVRFCLPAAQNPECPMVNAFWNGSGIYLGDGFAGADDVVAHELTHGVVEQTADLAYWYQSGAINESMADVFGELVDLTNPDAETEPAWQIGEGSPLGVIRSMSNPPSFDQPDRMTSSNYHAAPWNRDDFDNGGVHFNSGVGNKAAYLIIQGGFFNTQTITGIGYNKAARVYYQALQMLTAGADYADLYGVLPQACNNLAAGGVGGITSGDCVTVSQAVTATEMNKQPVVDAKAPDAPVCSSGTKADIYHDGFEGSVAHWSRTTGLWQQYGYARSGEQSLYGLEPDRASGDPATSYARLTKTFTIPTGAPAYLRFDHQYLLAYDPDAVEYYAGALLTYSTDGGKTFASTSTLPWVNGPTRSITPWNQYTQKFGTPYKGWGGDSHGYVSSRVDLSSLAGKTVMFRWRITADPDFYLDGWTLDNVNLYVCGGDRPSNVEQMKAVGGVNQAMVSWQPPVWPGTGGVTKYQVTAYKGSTLAKDYDNLSPATTSQVVSGLSSNTSYKFYVRAYSAGGSTALSKTLIGISHSSSLSPTTIYQGSSTKFSGKLTRSDNGAAVKGSRVYLQYRAKGSSSPFADLTSMLTSSTGSYAFTRKPTSSVEYRVQYRSGGTTYMGSTTGGRTVTVR